MPDQNTEMSGPETLGELEAITALFELARAFRPGLDPNAFAESPGAVGLTDKARIPTADARYRTLVEQLPAATFMASFENGRSEMYVSSYIEMLLGYTAAEWIEDPILWYQRLHPDDRARWNEDFVRTILSAEPF